MAAAATRILRDDRLSRRGFLGAAAGLVGTVGVGSLLGGTALAAKSGALAAHRKLAYRRLIEALGEQRHGGWRGPAAREAVARFDRWYGVQPPATRAQADFALDELASAWGSAARTPRERHRDLLEWAGVIGPAERSASPGESEARRRAAVSIAVGLASTGLGGGTAAELEAPR